LMYVIKRTYDAADSCKHMLLFNRFKDES
jgi:hypothetical protein